MRGHSVRSVTVEQYDDLLTQIYEAGQNPAAWNRVLHGIEAMTPGVVLNIQGYDRKTRDNFYCNTVNIAPERLVSYAKYYGQQSVWSQSMLSAPVSRVLSDEALYPREELLKTEYYNDWVKPQDNIMYGWGAVLMRDSGTLFSVAVNIPEKQVDEYYEFHHQLLERICPHIQRALQFQLFSEQAGLRSSRYEQSLDHIAQAIVLLDKSGRVCLANAAARNLFDQKILITRHDRRLATQCTKATRTIDAAIFGLDAGMGAFPSSGFLLTSRDGNRPLFGSIVPFECDLPEQEVAGIFSRDEIPALMVKIQSPANDSQSFDRKLQLAYELSEKEILLVKSLLDGKSPQNHADSRNISINTVKTQLKSCFSKMRVRRQSELVKLVQQLADMGD